MGCGDLETPAPIDLPPIHSRCWIELGLELVDQGQKICQQLWCRVGWSLLHECVIMKFKTQHGNRVLSDPCAMAFIHSCPSTVSEQQHVATSSCVAQKSGR